MLVAGPVPSGRRTIHTEAGRVAAPLQPAHPLVIVTYTVSAAPGGQVGVHPEEP